MKILFILPFVPYPLDLGGNQEPRNNTYLKIKKA